MNTITSIESTSPMAGLIRPGETIAAINGHSITDRLDYLFFSYDAVLSIDVLDADGKRRTVTVTKPEGGELGLVFDSYLMDSARSCRNRCVFCFIDQLPRGMRSTLYFKDDDARLSFLEGNYTTLTNLSAEDIERIIRLRISPINVSVHTTDPTLRAFMLGNPEGAQGYERLKKLSLGGIVLNCQIVCCPGINDGEQLLRTMRDLADLNVGSVSVVPVGLTKYRNGLHRITPYNSESARKLVEIADSFGDVCLNNSGSRVFYCADEFYLKAGLDIPTSGYYESYPQLENGVGMLRLLEDDFISSLEEIAKPLYPANSIKAAGLPTIEPFTIATGHAAAPTLRRLMGKLWSSDWDIFPIDNNFFGGGVDVAGLITGGDLIAQLRGRKLRSRLLIPDDMLRHGDSVFLDGVTVEQVSKELKTPVTPVASTHLLDAILCLN